MQHSTLALNKINLIAVQKFTAVTQQIIPVELKKPLFQLKIAYLKYCALCNLFI